MENQYYEYVKFFRKRKLITKRTKKKKNARDNLDQESDSDSE